MNKESALARLGLSGNEDTATVARAYGERLSAVQESLVSAQTDADRQQCQTKLAELVEAYEFVTGYGSLHEAQRPNDDSATCMRSGTELASGRRQRHARAHGAGRSARRAVSRSASCSARAAWATCTQRAIV